MTMLIDVWSIADWICQMPMDDSLVGSGSLVGTLHSSKLHEYDDVSYQESTG